MSTLHIKSFRKIVLGLLLVWLTSIYAYPYWMSNTTENTFGGPLAQNTTLEYYIIQGAVSFLDAYSNITQYLQKTEAMAIDASSTLELKVLLDRASVCMRQSNEYYRKLHATASATALNPTWIEALKKFDYEAFARANGEYINADLLQQVKAYLANGDVLGIYASMVGKTDQLVVLINRLKVATDSGVTISLADTWKLNHLFATTMIFGQYPAQVFYSILKNQNPLQEN